MTRGVLEYDLPEEIQELQDALDGWKWKAAMWQLDQWLRGEAKYQGRNELPVDEVRAKLRELLDGLVLE